MNRLSLFILYVMILTPVYSFGMHPENLLLNRGIPNAQLPDITGITACQDIQYKRPDDGEIFTIFEYCNSYYAYQKEKDRTHVYNNLEKGKDPCAKLSTETFNRLRSMSKQLAELHEQVDTQKSDILSFGRSWLSKTEKQKYHTDCGEKIRDKINAVTIAFVQGDSDDGFTDALQFEKQLNQIHQDILDKVHAAKLKFFGAITCASALLGLFGLYKLCQWWNATPENADTALDEDTIAAQENVPA